MNKYLGVKLLYAELLTGKERYGFDKPNNAISQIELDNLFYKVHRDGKYCWKRKDEFERDYRNIESLTFGFAVEALKLGLRISRKGWNGKGMWIELFKPTEYSEMTRPYLVHVAPRGSTNHYGDDIREFNKVPWLPSNTDILAEDWFVLND